MALINNWDLKEINNSVYQEKGERPRYVVTDLGATFGETGNTITRSKSNPEDYAKSEFVQKVTIGPCGFPPEQPAVFSYRGGHPEL